MKIKSNDIVKILAGKDKGKKGKISKVLKKQNKVVVEGANIIKKHIRARKSGDKGQIVEFSAPIDISNVILICPKCGKETKVGYLVMESGEKQRICKKCKQEIETKPVNN